MVGMLNVKTRVIIMDETKKHLIMSLLIKQGLNSDEVYGTITDIEKVIDSNYQNCNEVICDFETWTDNLLDVQFYEVKQTKDKFEVRPHNEKLKPIVCL